MKRRKNPQNKIIGLSLATIAVCLVFGLSFPSKLKTPQILTTTPTPNCNTKDMADCEEKLGCEWKSDSSATKDCKGLTGADCHIYSECDYTPAVSCSSFGSAAGCNDNGPRCHWQSKQDCKTTTVTKYCTSLSDCQNHDDCYYKGRCEGNDSEICGGSNQSACHNPCKWNPKALCAGQYQTEKQECTNEGSCIGSGENSSCTGTYQVGRCQPKTAPIPTSPTCTEGKTECHWEADSGCYQQKCISGNWQTTIDCYVPCTCQGAVPVRSDGGNCQNLLSTDPCSPSCDYDKEECVLMPNTNRHACQPKENSCEYNGLYYANGYILSVEGGDASLSPKIAQCIQNVYGYTTGWAKEEIRCNYGTWIEDYKTAYKPDMCPPEWAGCLSYDLNNPKAAKEFVDVDCCRKMVGSGQDIPSVCQTSANALEKATNDFAAWLKKLFNGQGI